MGSFPYEQLRKEAAGADLPLKYGFGELPQSAGHLEEPVIALSGGNCAGKMVPEGRWLGKHRETACLPPAWGGHASCCLLARPQGLCLHPDMPSVKAQLMTPFWPMRESRFREGKELVLCCTASKWQWQSLSLVSSRST